VPSLRVQPLLEKAFLHTTTIDFSKQHKQGAACKTNLIFFHAGLLRACLEKWVFFLAVS
jgi:hypothetical protein